jgi:hypothetical protein
MSLAEFLALPDDGNLHEFVRGEELLPGFALPLSYLFSQPLAEDA